MDNIVNDLRHENKFEICLKTSSSSFNCHSFFFSEADSKKHSFSSAKGSTLADYRGEANFGGGERGGGGGWRGAENSVSPSGGA